MMSGRHLYREQALASHRALVIQKTAEYQALVKTALDATTHPAPVAAIPTDPIEQGKTLFQACAACHAVNSRLIGPPLTEIARIYEGNPKGIVEWAKAPWKKRAGYPQMPAMSLPDEDLKLIAEYMIHAGGGH
jgi:cytochrome c